MRHVFTFDLLSNYSDFVNAEVICVIGDGQSNFVSMAWMLNTSKKIVHTNLAEILLSDLDLLEKLPGIHSKSISFVQNTKELKDALRSAEVKIILVSSSDREILSNSEISFFVNIASMQEMTNQMIASYFGIIKSNHAGFYCCNRESKVDYLTFEEVNFANYPWGEVEVDFLAECPWHKFYYSFRSFALFKKFPYDGAILHSVVKFH